jgi:hypothetical protein
MFYLQNQFVLIWIRSESNTHQQTQKQTQKQTHVHKHRFADNEIWAALDGCSLKTTVQTLKGGLLFELKEGGENLSQGQRQLLCLGRALLKKPKILCIDEVCVCMFVSFFFFVFSLLFFLFFFLCFAWVVLMCLFMLVCLFSFSLRFSVCFLWFERRLRKFITRTKTITLLGRTLLKNRKYCLYCLCDFCYLFFIFCFSLFFLVIGCRAVCLSFFIYLFSSFFFLFSLFIFPYYFRPPLLLITNLTL